MKSYVGATNRNFLDLVITEARTTSRPNGGSIAAHELGHSYGLVLTGNEEYDPDGDGDWDRYGNDASVGLFVNEKIPIQIPTERDTYCFMGSYGDQEFWADIGHYNELLSSHQVNSTFFDNSTVSSGAILAVGKIDTNDQVTLDNWYVIPEADIEAIPSGPYVFHYLDSGGNILYEQSFDIYFMLDTGESQIPLTETPIVMRIPNVLNTAKVEIIKSNKQLAEKIVSQNAPTVHVVSPNGGEVYSDDFNIQWSGSNLDGIA